MGKKLGVFRCFYCDRQLSRQKKTRDHMTPKSRNGSSAPRNIVDACRPCNNLKGCLTLDEFRMVIAYRMGIAHKPEFKFPGELRREHAGA
jgi:5-methylcytosine-specific restriction endonuclease McrA